MANQTDLVTEEAVRRALAGRPDANFAKVALQNGTSAAVVRRIARTMGFPPKKAGRTRKAITEETRERLHKLLRDGMPAAVAARQLGVTAYYAQEERRSLLSHARIEYMRNRQRALEMFVSEGCSAYAACKKFGVINAIEWVQKNAKLLKGHLSHGNKES